jgi:hypothetical protein
MHGVTSSQTGQGVPGLLLDANYGILPYASVYLLALGGVVVARGAGARLRLALPAALVYYLTVASHDTWTGAISNLGRFVMPLAPLAAAFVAVALHRSGARRGALALALTLSAWTAWCSRALWLDPHAANDATRLLARSAIADAAAYLPNLNLRRLADAAPGLPAQLLVWTALACLVALFLRRAAHGRGATSAGRALLGLTLALLSGAFVLERWPTPWRWPRFANRIELRTGLDVFVSGAGRVERGVVLTEGGALELLVRSRAPMEQLTLVAAGDGRLSIRRQPGLLATPEGARARLPLEPLSSLEGVRGAREWLSRQTVRVSTPGTLALRLEAPGTAQ